MMILYGSSSSVFFNESVLL